MEIRKYPYRWAVLAVFMFQMAIQQLLWITFAPITGDAGRFYHVNDLSIGILSMVFMIVYVVVSIPASWFIDTYGFRAAVGAGAVLTGLFGVLRGFAPANYTLVLLCQIGIAAGQPLIINAVTKVAARWFPIEERATASGLSWLAGYLGLIAGLVLTPILAQTMPIPGILLAYGLVSLVGAVAFVAFAKENPPTPQCTPEQEERSLVLDGIKQMLAKPQYIYLMIIFFIGLGVFNGLATWIENILKPRGFSSTQAGIVGGMMIVSGVVGSGIVPWLSDKFRNRSRFVLLAIAGSIPGLLGMAFASNYWVVMVSACVLGFFMLSTAPVAFQYGSELAYPAPEGTSTGVLMLMGQVSGIAFIFLMDIFKSPRTGSMTMSMVMLAVLMALGVFFCTLLRESELMGSEVEVAGAE